MLTKEECETALSKLWDNTFGTDCITGEDLDNAKKYKIDRLMARLEVHDKNE